MHPNITFTAAACAYIQKKVAKEQGIGFRLSIKKTGCSGYSYVPEIVSMASAKDISFKLDNGLTIFIDSAWVDLLQGIQVDYQEENKTGLKQKRLVFINPNESSRCGCGESFHVE